MMQGGAVSTICSNSVLSGVTVGRSRNVRQPVVCKPGAISNIQSFSRHFQKLCPSLVRTRGGELHAAQAAMG
jgi:hypothetical protein